MSGAHVGSIEKRNPAIAARAVDDSLWIIWQDTTNDDGDIYYGYSSDEGATWPGNTQLYAGPGAQHNPDLASDDVSGYLIAAWEDERSDAGDVSVARSATGLVWSEHRADDGPASSEQANPAVTVDPDGNVFLAWEDYRDNPNGEVYFARWLAGGTWGTWDTSAWSAGTRLSDAAMDWAASPSIAAAADGTLYAAWMERVPTGSATYDFQIVVAYSADQGATRTRQVVERVVGSSGDNAFVHAPSLATDLYGKVYVVWLYSPDSQSATSSVLFSQSPDGGVTWTEPVTMDFPAAQVSVDASPRIAVDGSISAVVAVWEDYREPTGTQIYASRYPGARYAAQGTWTRTFDAGILASWDRITWTATIPAQTHLQVSTRALAGLIGRIPWTPSLPSGAALTHPDARLLQVRAAFTSTLSPLTDTAILHEILVSCTPYNAVYLPLVLH